MADQLLLADHAAFKMHAVIRMILCPVLIPSELRQNEGRSLLRYDHYFNLGFGNIIAASPCSMLIPRESSQTWHNGTAPAKVWVRILLEDLSPQAALVRHHSQCFSYVAAGLISLWVIFYSATLPESRKHGLIRPPANQVTKSALAFSEI